MERNIRKPLSVLLALMMIFTLFDIPALNIRASAAGGSGTEADPYIISTAAELAALATEVNGGDNKSGKYYKLANDLTLTGTWTPIGTSLAYHFDGTFDGDGHKITGLDVNLTAESGELCAGLFGALGNGIVKNLAVEGNVTANDLSYGSNVYAYAGGICGEFFSDSGSSTIENCSFTGNVSASCTGADGKAFAGGICGINAGGVIKNCLSSGDITVNGKVVSVAGGICGVNIGTSGSDLELNGKVLNCCSSCTVTNRSANVADIYIGGVCGVNCVGEDYDMDADPAYAEIKNCYFDSDKFSGDAVGLNDGGTVTTNPAKMQNFKAKAGKDSIKLTWKRDKNADGYQLQMYKNGKWVNVKVYDKNTVSGRNIKGLKSKTTYKFRIRSFVNDANGKKVYGKYSTIKAKTKAA